MCNIKSGGPSSWPTGRLILNFTIVDLSHGVHGSY